MNNGKVKKTLVWDLGQNVSVYRLETVNGVTYGVYVDGRVEAEFRQREDAVAFAKKFV